MLGPNFILRGMNTKMRISPSLSPCSKTPCMTAMLDRLCQRPFRLHQLGKLQPEEAAVSATLRK